MSDSEVFAPLVVVRQADVPDDLVGDSVAETCTRCGALCWARPEAIGLAKYVFGTAAAICSVCAKGEARDGR